MNKFSASGCPQRSLLSHLVENGRLIREISAPARLPNVLIRAAIDKSSQAFPIWRSHVYTGEVRDVVLVKRKYFVTSKNEFLAEGLTHSDYFITWQGFDDSGLGKGANLVRSDALINVEQEPMRRYSQPCIFLGGDTINEPNFAHWFFEHLLKLLALKLSGVDMTLPIVISSRIPARFQEWGDLLLNCRLDWQREDLSAHVEFESAFLSSCPAYRRKGDAAPTIWDFGFDYLSSLFSTIASIDQQESTEGVYFLGRTRANWRRAANEEELYKLAQFELGAERIEISELTIAEQVRLAKSARILIIFAGADGVITNFCNPRCRVIEFAAPSHAAVYTAPIFCAIRGVRWTRVVAEKFVTEVKGPHPLDADYWVDPEKAKYCFKLLREEGI